MKNAIVIFFFACAIFTSNGQPTQPKRISYGEPDHNDIFYVMEQMGYSFFKIKLPVDSTQAFDIKVVIEEFKNRELQKTENIYLAPTIRKIIYRGETEVNTYAYDELSVILNADKRAERNTISIIIPGIMSRITPISLGEEYVAYASRPFEVKDLIYGEKFPVILYGAFWYDEQFGVHRFCGSNEVDADMEDELFDLSPHYYILSLVFTENNDGIRDVNKE